MTLFDCYNFPEFWVILSRAWITMISQWMLCFGNFLDILCFQWYLGCPIISTSHGQVRRDNTLFVLPVASFVHYCFRPVACRAHSVCKYLLNWKLWQIMNIGRNHCHFGPCFYEVTIFFLWPHATTGYYRVMCHARWQMVFDICGKTFNCETCQVLPKEHDVRQRSSILP